MAQVLVDELESCPERLTMALQGGKKTRRAGALIGKKEPKFGLIFMALAFPHNYKWLINIASAQIHIFAAPPLFQIIENIKFRVSASAITKDLHCCQIHSV